MTTRAIVRLPGPTFASGLTTAKLGAPRLTRTVVQHTMYCQALNRCGVEVLRLPAEPELPDAPFVEDTAIVADRCAVLTLPGADSRRGEVASVARALAPFYYRLDAIELPGTLDGGDVCQAGEHFFIGISARTNAEGARQLAEILDRAGYTASCIELPREEGTGLLHLKSGLSYLGDRTLVVAAALAAHPAFAPFKRIVVEPAETYAANCVRVNDHVLLAGGFPLIRAALEDRAIPTIELEMSEFRKMDGGLSCLSIRF